MLMGVSPDYVHAYAENYKLTLWPRSGDAATLVVLPDRTRYQDKASSYLDPAMVAVDPPPQAESARLYLDFGSEEVYIDDDKVPVTLTYTLEGERQEGVFFFQLKHQYRHLTMQEDETEEQQLLSRTEDTVLAFLDMDSPDQLSFSYILTFYDGDGDLLETVASP